MTPENKEKFLSVLRKGHSVSRAAKAVGVSRTAVYEHREMDREFREQWDGAVEEGSDRLEDEAHRRAHDGTLKPVYYKGAKVGSIREYSDTLMIFLLKARRPDKYRERLDVKVDDWRKELEQAGLNAAQIYDQFVQHLVEQQLATLEAGDGPPDGGGTG